MTNLVDIREQVIRSAMNKFATNYKNVSEPTIAMKHWKKVKAYLKEECLKVGINYKNVLTIMGIN